MSEVNDVARVAEVAWGGRTWQVPRPNYGTEGLYARFLRKNAVADLDALAAEISPRAYEAGMAAITRDFAARLYDWGGDLWKASLGSESCLREALQMILSQVPDQRDLGRTQMERFWAERTKQLIAAWNEVTAPSPPTPPQEAAQGAKS